MGPAGAWGFRSRAAAAGRRGVARARVPDRTSGAGFAKSPATLARRADEDISGICRGGPTKPASSRASETGGGCPIRDTRCGTGSLGRWRSGAHPYNPWRGSPTPPPTISIEISGRSEQARPAYIANRSWRAPEGSSEGHCQEPVRVTLAVAGVGLARRRRGARRKSMPKHRRRRATKYGPAIPTPPEGSGGAGPSASLPRFADATASVFAAAPRIWPRGARNATARVTRTGS